MFLFFHIFIPLFLNELLVKFTRLKYKLIRVWIIVGSILPDLIDKPISLIFYDEVGGRGYAHTPFLIITSSIILFFLLKQKLVAISLFYGELFHLILDIPAVPWFWPIIPITIYHSNIENWFYDLFHNPLIYLTELSGVVGIIIIAIINKIIFTEKLINWENLKFFLFNHSQIIKNLKN